MLKLKILSIGKTKEPWLEGALAEYTKRLKPFLSIEWVWAKEEAQLVTFIQKEPYVFCLDPEGTLLNSKQFASFIEEAWKKGGSRLALVIGGAEGLPKELKMNHRLISLSPLTFTHQITRLVLIEQIYRAMEIIKGSPYHK